MTPGLAREIDPREATTVLHLVDNFSVGGTPIKAIRFASSSPRQLIRPLLAAFNGSGSLAEEARELGLNPYSFNGDDTQLGKFLRQEAVDSLIVHSGFPGVYKAVLTARRVGVKHVLRTNEFGWVDRVDSSRLADKNLFLSRFALARFKRLSRLSWDEVLGRSFVTYMPVDPVFFHPTTHRTTTLEKDIGGSGDSFILGRVGRPDPSKWDSFLVKVLKLLNDARKDWIFLVIGGLPPRIKTAIGNQGFGDRVRVIDGPLRTNDVAHYLARLHVYCHTSRVGETFGLAVAEAMASGLPVVSQQTPYSDDGVSEVIAEGRNGFLEITPEGFARSLRTLLDKPDLRLRFGGESRAIAGSRFGTEVLGQRFHAITLAENGRDSVSTLAGVGLSGPLSDAMRELRDTPDYWRRYLTSIRSKWSALSPSEKNRILWSWSHTYCVGRRAYFAGRARIVRAL